MSELPLTVVGVPVSVLLQLTFLFVRLAIDYNMEALYRRTDPLIHFNEATLPGRLVAYLRSSRGRHIFVDFGQLWLSREYHRVEARAEVGRRRLGNYHWGACSSRATPGRAPRR